MTVDRAARLAELGLRLVAAVQRGDPDACAAMVAGLDRAELEHLVLLLAASVPDELPAPGRRPLPPVDVADLVAERFGTGRARAVHAGRWGR